jgi:hypothetical protein
MIKNVKPDADSLLFSEFAPEDEMQEAMVDLLESHRVSKDNIQQITACVVRAMDSLKQLSPPSGKDGYVEVHIEIDDNRFRAKIDQIAGAEYSDVPGGEQDQDTEDNQKDGELDLPKLQDQMDEVKLDYRDGFHTTLELIRILG